ncbi:MAG: hypothetical protein ACPGWR_22430 [Ardenticatenaceae bacterium]
MTPTLFGRWQTRVFLLGTYGVLITLFFGWLFSWWPEPGDPDSYTTTLSILGYVILFGFGWDLLYNYLQTFSWDSDWPPTHQLAAGIVEAIFLWILLLYVDLPGVAFLELWAFVLHYSTVWIITFLLSQSAMRIWFPRWRYNGGQWL